MGVFEGLIAAVNIFLAYLVFKLTRKDVNPKLYILSKIDDTKNSELFYDVALRPAEECNFDQQGFPEISHEEKLWKMELHNNGNLPATNIILEYVLTIKKAELEFGIDEADIVSHEFVDFKTYTQKVEIDYLAPNSFKKIDIVYLYGEFPKADLKVYWLVSKEESFIKRPILIDSYEHPEFLQIQDSQHGRQMFGAYKRVTS